MGNTDTFKEYSRKFEDLILEDLGENYDAMASSDDLEASSSADIEVIIGAN